MSPSPQIESSPLYNKDLAPAGEDRRHWGTYNYAALWVSMSVNILTYMLAASLIQGGMNWKQAVATVFIGNTNRTQPLLPLRAPPTTRPVIHSLGPKVPNTCNESSRPPRTIRLFTPESLAVPNESKPFYKELMGRCARETVKYEPQIMCLKTALHPLRADALALHERIWNF